jgi:hypothetical protein
MKKCNSLKLLFLFLFALGKGTNVFATIGDNGDIIPEYVIDAPWPTDYGSSTNTPKEVFADNNQGNNLGVDSSEDKLSENDLRDINSLNLTEEDFGDEEGLISKIKSKLPNIKISKKLVKKVLKATLIAGAVGVISYGAYKLVSYAAKAINSTVGVFSKSAAILGLCILFLKYATGGGNTDQY